MLKDDIFNRIADNVRVLSVDAIGKANSGHPGLPLGTAELGTFLYGQALKMHPKKPFWFSRDRFVLSAGHGSMLLYSMLHLSGYDLSLEDIKEFRQIGSKTPGHPEYGHTPGVEMTTGPLGQGIAHAVGLAAAEARVSTLLNTPDFPIFNNYTYVLSGEGDLMEGVSYEACSLAGHLGLGRLIVFYDCNHISIDGDTHISFTEDIRKRFETFNFQVLECDDPYKLSNLAQVTKEAQQETQKPTLVILHTHIGHKSVKEDSAKVHGSPLNPEEIKQLKEKINFPVDKDFYVDPKVYDYFHEHEHELAKAYEKWEQQFNEWGKKYPEKFAIWRELGRGDMSLSHIKWPEYELGNSVATRNAYGETARATLASYPHHILIGCADLAGSCGGLMGDAFLKDHYDGMHVHFGIREHAMAAFINGITLYSTMRSVGATFFTFSDYMKPSIRLAALMGIPSMFVFTHDSIFLGEDGPTHQSIEHLAAARIIPDVFVFRPGDAQEVVEMWKFMFTIKNNPMLFVLSRQKLPVYEKHDKNWKENIKKGAYLVYKTDKKLEGIILATGSEVHTALEVAKESSHGLNVISVSSKELFEAKENASYHKELVPCDTPVFVVEAGISATWDCYVCKNPKSAFLGMPKSFGLSGKAEDVARHFHIDKDSLIQRIDDHLKK